MKAAVRRGAFESLPPFLWQCATFVIRFLAPEARRRAACPPWRPRRPLSGGELLERLWSAFRLANALFVLTFGALAAFIAVRPGFAFLADLNTNAMCYRPLRGAYVALAAVLTRCSHLLLLHAHA